MKKLIGLLLLCTFIMYGCQSMEAISIDYMQPAKITFPSELKRIGIVNNVPTNMPIRIADRYKDVDQSDINRDGALRQTKYFNGDAKKATEALAQSIADENYFDLVIICDSALRQHDTRYRNGGLTSEEIDQLTSDLGVDAIISLESVQFREVREIGYIPDFNIYMGDVQLNVFSTTRVYFPGHGGPVAVINGNDSIYWNEAGNFSFVKSALVSEEEMLKQASDFAGTLAVKFLLPYWTTSQRYYFTSGNVKMRDATVKVSENKWDEALSMWTDVFHSTDNARKQCYAAYNIALGYEMQDSIETAYHWCETAVEKARVAEKIPADITGLRAENAQLFMLTQSYLANLEKRKEEQEDIRSQLVRFKE